MQWHNKKEKKSMVQTFDCYVTKCLIVGKNFKLKMGDNVVENIFRVICPCQAKVALLIVYNIPKYYEMSKFLHDTDNSQAKNIEYFKGCKNLFIVTDRQTDRQRLLVGCIRVLMPL